jgi:hypothetical protein
MSGTILVGPGWEGFEGSEEEMWMCAYSLWWDEGGGGDPRDYPWITPRYVWQPKGPVPLPSGD